MRTAETGAANIIAGTVSRAATWYENIELTQDGDPLTGVDGFDWEMTFRKCPTDSADLTLSTDDGTLVIVEDDDVTLFEIRCASTRLSSMCGDYICDIKATDSATTVDGESRILHFAHGVVTFLNDPTV